MNALGFRPDGGRYSSRHGLSNHWQFLRHRCREMRVTALPHRLDNQSMKGDRTCDQDVIT